MAKCCMCGKKILLGIGSSFSDFGLDMIDDKLCVQCASVFREVYNIGSINMENSSEENEDIINKYKIARRSFLENLEKSGNENIKKIMREVLFYGDEVIKKYNCFEKNCESVIDATVEYVNRISGSKLIFHEDSAFGVDNDIFYYIPYGNSIKKIEELMVEADCNTKIMFSTEIENMKSESGNYIFEIPINCIHYFQERGGINYSTEVHGGGGNIKGANVAGVVAGKLMFGNIGAIIGSSVGTKGTINEVYSQTIEHDNRYVILRYKQGNSTKELKFDFSCYEILVSLIPKKDYNTLQLGSAIEENNNELNDVEIPVEQIKKLKQIYDAGLITEEEFSQKKKQLLGI